MLKSRASDSFTSQVKDFIEPVPTQLTNCGAVIIRKQTDPDEDPNTTEFGDTKTCGTDPESEDTFTLTDDGVKTFSGVLFGTDYTVTEDDVPDGWDFVEVDCSASSGATPSVDGATVTFDIDDQDDVLDCTYTNRARGTLVVEKVTNDGDGAFEFTSETLTPSPFALTTTEAGTPARMRERSTTSLPGHTTWPRRSRPAGTSCRRV